MPEAQQRIKGLFLQYDTLLEHLEREAFYVCQVAVVQTSSKHDRRREDFVILLMALKSACRSSAGMIGSTKSIKFPAAILSSSTCGGSAETNYCRYLVVNGANTAQRAVGLHPRSRRATRTELLWYEPHHLCANRELDWWLLVRQKLLIASNDPMCMHVFSYWPA